MHINACHSHNFVNHVSHLFTEDTDEEKLSKIRDEISRLEMELRHLRSSNTVARLNGLDYSIAAEDALEQRIAALREEKRALKQSTTSSSNCAIC